MIWQAEYPWANEARGPSFIFVYFIVEKTAQAQPPAI